MTSIGQTSIRRYLTLAGITNRWFIYASLSFAALIAYTRIQGERANAAPLVFLFLVPIATGTGLLSVARSGHLDLLLGAGRTRSEIWQATFFRAWIVPSLIAAAVTVSSGMLQPQQSTLEAMLRLTATMLFAGGVSFAAGLLDPRYVTGVLWLLLRLVFLMIPAGLSTFTLLAKGVSSPSTVSLIFAVVAAPETLLEPRMPAAYPAVAATCGALTIAASRAWFVNAEFGGKRQ